jgi:hypothetical protein
LKNMTAAFRETDSTFLPARELPEDLSHPGHRSIRLQRAEGVAPAIPEGQPNEAAAITTQERSVEKAREEVSRITENTKKEKILVYDLAFIKGEQVNYQDKKGNVGVYTVEGLSEDIPPGLILKSGSKQIAIGAEAVKTRVSKIDLPKVTEQNLNAARTAFDSVLKKIALDEDYKNTLRNDLGFYQDLALRSYEGEPAILRTTTAKAIQKLEDKLIKQGFKVTPDGSLRYSRFLGIGKSRAESSMDYRQWLALKDLQDSAAILVSIARPSEIAAKAVREMSAGVKKIG